ncbi:hypothetical protein [Kribbella sp. NPDC023855]|uniref:hypothetical protein n=1 Tax=Kribbella sp. NPDC023855 TaxID=3154698 RepID=UPI0033FF9657
MRVLTTQQSSAGKLKAGETRIITVPQVPANATAVAISVTAIKGTAAGYLKAFPGGEAQPVSSTVSFNAGQIIANYATIKLGVGRKLAIFNKFGAVDVNIDLQGYYLPPFTGSVGVIAYARVLANGTVHASFSSTGTITAVKDLSGGVGSYLVALNGLADVLNFASVQVTPISPASGIVACGVVVVSGLVSRVKCADSTTGQPRDAEFMVTVMA